ncbi:hypothetical protein EU803_17965 [Loktanella sp. IMCC34160]|uniref:hypothetical protein n=1 Tax=Loktanella sp. IMCC34160 TaxID=2510646 RepID=UPI00101CACF3|nr:hypothetical protein [Loktanella sp. IMCC34160]RYG89358.1 hypothetical protein EU803_17965 [Loktanella sp. IMCC34160]
MTDKDLSQTEDRMLEALFAEARSARVADPSEALMQAILGDAAEALEASRPVPVAAARPGFLAGLWAALGGVAGVSGLATAAAVGVWFGVAPPAGLDGLSTAIWGESVSVSIFSADDILGLEG